jgi:hypothetical protein
MFKISYKSILKSVLVILIVLYGCSEETPVQKSDSVQVVEDNAVVKRILRAGFKKEDIIEFDDHYVVDGDIIFYKSDPAPTKSPSNGRSQQARADFLVSPANYNINVYLNTASFSSIDLAGPLSTVISAYNALGSQIHLSRVYSAGEADIEIVKSDFLPFGVCGQAGFPFSDGRAFDKVNISESTLTAYNLVNPSQLTLLVAHEIGHCIGLRHTNWESLGETAAIHINGTPTFDNVSVMNGSTCGNYWGGFSSNDGVAITVLYSNTPAPSGDDVLNANEQLLQNEFLRSSDGRFTLYMQGDGNLVIYYYNQALWASNTCCNSSINRCVMQGDGNLVLYDVNYGSHWHSGTDNYPGSHLVMQSDGNLVIYQGNTPRWASNTCCY